jgi:hypothetical protein
MQREDHGHAGRCNHSIVFERHDVLTPEGWFAVAWTPLNGGTDEPARELRGGLRGLLPPIGGGMGEGSVSREPGGGYEGPVESNE